MEQNWTSLRNHCQIMWTYWTRKRLCYALEGEGLWKCMGERHCLCMGMLFYFAISWLFSIIRVLNSKIKKALCTFWLLLLTNVKDTAENLEPVTSHFSFAQLYNPDIAKCVALFEAKMASHMSPQRLVSEPVQTVSIRNSRFIAATSGQALVEFKESIIWTVRGLWAKPHLCFQLNFECRKEVLV